MSKRAPDSRPLLRSILSSGFWRKAQTRAGQYAEDPQKLANLVDAASRHTKTRPRGWTDEVWTYLKAMLRLLRAYWKGTFRDVPKGALLSIIAAVVYFVMPIDVIPDFLLGLGFVDDAAVVVFVLRNVKDVLDRFLAWEAAAQNAT
jgi:uncharacterized membrane protein YkvA (DUF1232 family)